MTQHTPAQMAKLKKARRNRRKNSMATKRKQGNATKIAMDLIEKDNLDMLDPLKNPNPNDDQVETDATGRRIVKRTRLTWAERMTTPRGLGVKLPKFTGRSVKESAKRREARTLKYKSEKIKEWEKKMEEKARRKAEAQKKKGAKKEEKEEEVKDEMVEGEEGERPKKRVKVEKKASVYTIMENAPKQKEEDKPKVYDIWAKKEAPPVLPKEEFIYEFLHPPERTYSAKVLPSKRTAVPLPHPGQSYRPDPKDFDELKEIVTKQRKNQAAKEEHATKIIENKEARHKYYLAIDKNKGGEDEEKGDGLEFVNRPLRHKTEKERMMRTMRKNELKSIEIATWREEEEQKINNLDEIIEEIEVEDEKKAKKNKKRKELDEKRQLLGAKTADNRNIRMPRVAAIGKKNVHGRISTLRGSGNPLGEHVASMQSRGVWDIGNRNRAKKPVIQKKFLVMKEELKEDIEADTEKYLLPLYEKQVANWIETGEAKVMMKKGKPPKLVFSDEENNI